MNKSINIFGIQRNQIVAFIIVIVGLFTLAALTAGKTEHNNDKPPAKDELSFLEVDLGKLDNEAKLAYEMKDFREAKKIYLEILHYKSNDVSVLYNIANCYALLNKPELAAKALNFAIDAGLNDLSGTLADSIWTPILNDEKFIPVIEKVKTLKYERGKSFYSECKVLVRGQVRIPDNYDSTKAYPLLILLHGYGASANSFIPVRDMMEATNFFVAAPQGPYAANFLDKKDPSYSWFFRTRDKKIWEKADPPVIQYILSVIDDFKTRYKISGVYILGFSQGGALSYMTGIKNPDKVSGIICFGASNPKDYISSDELDKASAKLPIFIGNGWSDPQGIFDEAQEAKNLFLKYKFNVAFRPFDGGHWLDKEALIEARKWIEENEKKKI